VSAGASLEAPCEVKSLAALIFKDNEAVNEIVSDFAAGLKSRGHRIAGMIQAVDLAQPCDCREVFLRDVATGEAISILQDLGSGSQSCRIDTAALAEAAHRVARALASAPELLFVNRFGKLEADGLGLYAEIGAAAAAGIPTLVCVSMKFIDPWRRFTMGLDEELPCSGAALERWWGAVKGRSAAGDLSLGAAL
jgi:hypothetical protein